MKNITIDGIEYKLVPVVPPKESYTASRKIGDKFRCVLSDATIVEYVLCTSAPSVLQLNDIKTGYRVDDGVKVLNTQDVTEKEWNLITAYKPNIFIPIVKFSHQK